MPFAQAPLRSGAVLSRTSVLGLTAVLVVSACGDDGPTEPAATLNLTVDRAYLVQAVQRPDGSVPLVAGRSATVRVFPIANEANSAAPTVRVRLLENGVPFDSVDIASPGPGVPTSIDETAVGESWDAPFTPAQVRPGLSIEVVVDPGNEVPEASDTDNAFRPSGALALTVEEAPPLRVRFVPVINGGEVAGLDAAVVANYMALARKIFPAATFEISIRVGALNSAVADVSADPGAVLQEVRALQQSEGDGHIYVGVIADAAWPGGSGLAQVGGYATIIREGTTSSRPIVFAHQLGHSFGRTHPPGCETAGDGEFPYADDAIGQVGFDDGVVIGPDTQDIMSICSLVNPWVSDYTWEAILDASKARAGS